LDFLLLKLFGLRGAGWAKRGKLFPSVDLPQCGGFNFLETIFIVLPKIFEIFESFVPVTSVLRPLRGVRKLRKAGGNPEKRRFRCKKVKLVDIW
jgi:hypothetical protein